MGLSHLKKCKKQELFCSIVGKNSCFLFLPSTTKERKCLCVFWSHGSLSPAWRFPAPVLCQPGPGVLGHGCSGTPHSRQRSVCSPALLLFSSFLSPFGTCVAWSRVTGLRCQPPVCSPSSIEGGGGQCPRCPVTHNRGNKNSGTGLPRRDRAIARRAAGHTHSGSRAAPRISWQAPVARLPVAGLSELGISTVAHTPIRDSRVDEGGPAAASGVWSECSHCWHHSWLWWLRKV